MTRHPARAAIAAVVATCWLVLVAAGPALAAYQTVSGGRVQWEWAGVEQPGQFQVTDVVVREDGWMIVSTATFADGFLHLIPPWGAPVDASNRLGSQSLGFRQLELRRGRLFGLRQEVQRQDDETHNPGLLVELDAGSGAVLRTHGSWWYQDLAVDPLSEDLVLQTSGGGREPYRHDVVRYDPDSATTRVLLADTEPRSDRAFELAFSPDGQQLFTANVTDVPATIDVRRRDGTHLHTLQSGQVDSLVVGKPGSCFEGLLVITRFDGSVWAIPPAAGSAPAPLAGGGRAAVVSYAANDRDGNVATARYADITLLACPGFLPPKPPTPALPETRAAVPAAPDAPLAAAIETAPPPAAASPAAPGQAPPPAPSAPPPPGPPAPPPPPAAAAPVAPPSALGGAAQAASAPSVGAADSPDEEHTTSVAASARITLTLSLGAVVAMAMVSYAVAGAPPAVPRIQRVRGNP